MKPNILQEIFEAKRRRIADRRENADMLELAARSSEYRAGVEANRLQKALKDDGINIIAEFKRASPSKGIINDYSDPAGTVVNYERGGAKAVSVLTEEDYFKGSLDDLSAVRSATPLPILQKDFVFAEYQIYEAALAGADAVLLIVAMLDDSALKSLYDVASGLGLDALVEIHDREEMERVVRISPGIIGINNRNLKTFDVSLDTSRELIRFAPSSAVVVAESGLRTRDEIRELNKLGFRGFLIGETLMRSTDPDRILNELIK